ncbi:3-oxoadipate enol-lactonase [Oceaniglobus ichthyenteri]|uniref:3-oxoadipate enol-lactonase n=1 Tax=Oceaniglobus ichthyenteri TaxID=2136177 RepID=UPI000D345BF3|nr:3-oxoadipate enol-lactonase [Oceaniglobus ichthyenteri]
MRAISANGVTLHVQTGGNPAGAPVLFANSLGTDLRLWDALIALLPPDLRLIRYDMRGHGLSGCPDGPYTMDDLTADAEALIETLELGAVTFVGLSIGGMVGQSLAARRPDLVRALVLSNTAARMGDAASWDARIAAITADGLASMADAILDRWFAPRFRATPEADLWGAMLARTPQTGYLGCCAAIANADLTDATQALRLPTLAIAGSDDGASPADLVAATAALVPGAAFHVIDGTGHLPCVEDPAAYAAILTPFLKEHANV